MKLSLRSWGGFAGPAGAVTRIVDLAALPDDRRRHAQELVDAAHVFDRPPKMMLSSPHPWDFNYLLHIDQGARAHQIQLQLDAVDPPLRALVEWIEQEAPRLGTTPGG